MNYEIWRHPNTGERVLTFRGDVTPDALELARREGVLRLRLSIYNGWRERSIAFLQDFDYFTTIDIIAGERIADMTPLYRLTQLRTLNLDGEVGKVDFTSLPNV
jgi:hypothetical protein